VSDNTQRYERCPITPGIGWETGITPGDRMGDGYNTRVNKGFPLETPGLTRVSPLETPGYERGFPYEHPGMRGDSLMNTRVSERFTLLYTRVSERFTLLYTRGLGEVSPYIPVG